MLGLGLYINIANSDLFNKTLIAIKTHQIHVRGQYLFDKKWYPGHLSKPFINNIYKNDNYWSV